MTPVSEIPPTGIYQQLTCCIIVYNIKIIHNTLSNISLGSMFGQVIVLLWLLLRQALALAGEVPQLAKLDGLDWRFAKLRNEPI